MTTSEGGGYAPGNPGASMANSRRVTCSLGILLLTLPRPAPSASPRLSADPCECKLQAPEVVPGLPLSPACAGTLSIETEQYPTSSPGRCINGESCTVGVDCKVDGSIRVITSSPCRVRFSRDGQHVAGGVQDVDIGVLAHLECFDWVEYEVSIGTIVVATVNFFCSNCTG